MKSTAAVAKVTSESNTKPFRSMIGRTPDVQLHGDLRISPLAPEPATAVIAAGKFKATCLQLLDRSAKGETITITKRGKVVGRLVPPEPDQQGETAPLWGRMKGRIKILGDVVSPDFEAWGMPDPRKQKKA